MNRLLKIAALLGLAGVARAGPSSPPAGNYLLNVSTLVASPAFNVSSGTVRTQLNINYGTRGNLLYLSTAGVVATTTTMPTGGDVFKASANTFTAANTFSTTTFTRPIRVQTTTAGQSSGGGGSILVYATDDTGMPFQIYTSSANQAGYFGLVNLIASNTNYANAMIYITGTSSSSAKADLYISNPRPNIQLYQTGGASPYGQYEFIVVGDTLQFNAMNSGGSAQKARLGMSHPGALLFYETTDNGHFVALKASATISSNVTWVLPAADGTVNQVLSTNGSGVISWVTQSGNGGLALQPSTATITISSGLAFSGDPGTSGQILASQGANTVPHWITGAGTGDAILASTQTFSGTDTFTHQLNIAGTVPILSTSSLQTGATFYVSSGTANTFNVNSALRVPGTATFLQSPTAPSYSITGFGPSFWVGSSNSSVSAGSAGLISAGTNPQDVCVGVNTCDNIATSNVTAVGFRAGQSDTTGSDNVFVGDYSGNSVSSGTRITCLGAGACQSTIGANSNVVVGYAAMNKSVNASNNVCIGSGSCDLMKDGSANTVIGYAAGNDLTYGNQNVCIGSTDGATQSCQTLITGSSNTMVGNGSGGALTVNGGNQGNTFIGWDAGSQSTNVITNSIAIGYKAIVNSSYTMQLGGTGVDAVTVNGSTFTFSSGAISGPFIATSVTASTVVALGQVQANSGLFAGTVRFLNSNLRITDNNDSGDGITSRAFNTTQASMTVTGTGGLNSTFGISAATMTVRSSTFSVAGVTYYFPTTGGSGTQVLTTSGGSSAVNLTWATPNTGYTINPATTFQTAYFSNSNTIDGTSQLTINGSAIAINGDATFGGMVKLTSKTLANLASTTPTAGAGQVFYCSDCVTDALCVSTQTATASWARVSAKTVACQ